MRTKNQKKIFILITLFLIVVLLGGGNVLASNNEVQVEVKEYTEEYQKWLELPEEERSKVLAPRMFEVPKTTYYSSNPLKQTRLLKSSLVSSYDLRDYIPENLIVRNQMDTPTCWAFASLAALETNLALSDYYSNVTTKKIYNFSERHMDYATSRRFLNGAINESGYNRVVGDPLGEDVSVALTYLTNGLGAVDENSMPFENNSNLINITEIQNKLVTSKVADTIIFPSYEVTDDTTQIKSQMKEHIRNYGGIIAGIHGAQLNSAYYNNKTGAIYCDDKENCIINHAVIIIGWDDDYETTNFALLDANNDGDYDDAGDVAQPENNGAWIIKNSWGDKKEVDLDELIKLAKEELFKEYQEKYIADGYTEASKVPEEDAIETILKSGYTIEGDKAILKTGDDGFMYVSYEDVNIYSQLIGIVNSSNSVDYENIYQYNQYGNNAQIAFVANKLYIANVFEKTTSEKEFLTQVSIDAPETYTCKVYVNPNGNSKAKDDLDLVELKAGETETFGVGYHTMEFLEPIEITGEEFVVVIEIQGTQTNQLAVSLEVNVPNSKYDVVTTEKEKCFYANELAFGVNQWQNFSELEVDVFSAADTTIKAFTISDIKNIEITTPPTKTSYVEGEDFDKTNMVVKANYNNGTSEIITDYNIIDGLDLELGQTTVTLMYRNKTVTQAITVVENNVDSIRIKTPPKTTKYIAGQKFDRTGMVVEAIYKDGNIVEITDYDVEDGEKLQNGQTTVTISYKGKTVTQAITVQENKVEKIEIQTPPEKTKYVVGQDFDRTGMIVIATYEDGTTKTITDYIVVDGTNLQKNQTTVTIRYEGKTITQTILVEEKSVTSITIKQTPTKTTYIQNKEELDLTGGMIAVTYNDGSTENLSMTSTLIQVSGFDNTKLGQLTITLTYERKTVNFVVEIKEEVVEPDDPNEPVNPDKPTEPDETNPENSNFENAQGNVKSIKAYYYTDKNKKDYVVMETEVTGIVKNKSNDKVEYYYYLSSKQAEGYIQDWVKIDEVQSLENDKLSFVINTKEISNYEEVSNADVLYLYIKEVAIKDVKQKTVITGAMQLKTNVVIEEYVDDDKKVGTNGNNTNHGSGVGDNTVADGTIPQTGQGMVIICSIVLITVLGVVGYIKYKRIDK